MIVAPMFCRNRISSCSTVSLVVKLNVSYAIVAGIDEQGMRAMEGMRAKEPLLVLQSFFSDCQSKLNIENN